MRLLPTLMAAALIPCLMAAALHAQVFDAWQTKVGYGDLAAALGSQTPTGIGVPIAQIEPTEAGGKYYVFLDNAELQVAAPVRPTALVPADGSGSSANGGSGHATSTVGRYIWGNFTGLARGANQVTLYEAGDWVNNKLFAGSSTAPQAADFNFRVQNHSWVSLPTSPVSTDQRTLRHYDYAIDAFNITAMVGANNNELASPAVTHPRLLSHAYNALTIGRTDGKHSRGLTTSDYFGGRVKPDLVAPGTLTSSTTGMASSAAAILHDRANDLPALGLATNNEVMKAILMAGATKHDNIPVVPVGGGPAVPTPLAGWDRTETRPLDDIYGAGQLNVFNSYKILDGGRQAGGTPASHGAASFYGWDYQDLKSSGATTRIYDFTVPAGMTGSDLSIILSWNATVADPGSWTDSNSDVTLKNLDLELSASNGGVIPVGSIVRSRSTVDNVEHIYIPGALTAGTYSLAVTTPIGPIGWDYGLAWRMSTSRLLSSADFDGDGFVDGADLLIWQRNLGKLVNATLSQGDANGDGAVDGKDLDVFDAQITPAEVIAAALQARAAVSAIPEPSSAILVFGSAALMAAAARRRTRRGRA